MTAGQDVVLPLRKSTTSYPARERRSEVEVLDGRACSARPWPARTSDVDRSIYLQDWWLAELQKSASYREIRLAQAGVDLVRFPFSLRHRFGLAGNPDWTRITGPLFSSDLDAAERRAGFDAVLAALPRAALYFFSLSPSDSHADALIDVFARHGFEHTTQPNYVRRPEDWATSCEDEAMDRILSDYSRKRRLHIRQAERMLVVEAVEPGAFVSMYEDNLASLAAGPSIRPLSSAYGLLAAARARGQARILGARRRTDVSGSHDAALACIWDRSRYYYWMSTRRAAPDEAEERPHPDAVKLLAVRALAHAQTLGLTFDADGAITPGATHLYRDILGLSVDPEMRHEFWRHTAASRLYFSRAGQAVKDALVRRLRPAR